MKRGLFISAALTTASPAFAHVDGHFHTHGMEIMVALSVVAAGIAAVLTNR